MIQKNHDAMPSGVDTYGCSQKGERHDTNDDQYLVAEIKRAARIHHASESNLDDSRRFGSNQAHVLLVADGVSGQPGGLNASRLVVDEVMESLLNAVPWTRELDVDSEAKLRRQLKETVVRCNDQVARAAGRSSGPPEMASTLTMAFVRWPTAFIVHAGDSRAYLIRDRNIEQLTVDHTLAQQLVADGELDPREAETSRFANLLWNAVGGSSDVKPDLTVKDLRCGDTLLLCSDGLTSYLNADSIRHLVETSDSAREACEELVGTIRELGGHDDVTVAMARFGDEVEVPAAAAASQPPGGAAAAATIPKPAVTTRRTQAAEGSVERHLQAGEGVAV